MSKKRPTLRGVIFDMDGTLTVPNLDFAEMYKRCGVSQDKDILTELALLPQSEAKLKYDIIEEIEAEATRTMKCMPGAPELMQWFLAHKLPTALVTRNTLKSARALEETLGPFDIVVARDSHDDIAPKPDPSAMNMICRQWGVDTSEVLMIGDSPANDIVFGKSAGASTALLQSGREVFDADKTSNADDSADFVVEHLHNLPHQLWQHFEIEGDLGTSVPLLKYDIPAPDLPSTKAAFEGSFPALDSINDQDSSGNTPLVWAADAGHLHVVKYLLEQPGINLDTRGYLGATAVCRASRRGHAHVLRLLLDAGANPDIANTKLQYPLHFAAFKENMEAVKMLLDHGVNTRVLDRKGRIPAPWIRKTKKSERLY